MEAKMSTMRMLSLAFTASICWAAVSQAAPVSLNVKYGLWAMTTTGTASGTPPVPAANLARLTPAQRAQVAAAMSKAMGVINQPQTYNSCVTADSLQRGFKDPDLSNGCTQTIVSSTPTDMMVKVACTGSHRMQGTFHFQASSPEAISGTVDMTVSDGGGAMKVDRQITGKWLSADCGDVKP
jgi:hypothetical protein